MTQYGPVTAEVIAELEQVVPGRVVVGEDVNPDYSRDEVPIYGTGCPRCPSTCSPPRRWPAS